MDCGLREFARRTGLSPSYLSDFLNGHRGLAVRTALVLEAATNWPAGMWLRAQREYDAARLVERHELQESSARARMRKRLEEVRACFGTAAEPRR